VTKATDVTERNRLMNPIDDHSTRQNFTQMGGLQRQSRNVPTTRESARVLFDSIFVSKASCDILLIAIGAYQTQEPLSYRSRRVVHLCPALPSFGDAPKQGWIVAQLPYERVHVVKIDPEIMRPVLRHDRKLYTIQAEVHVYSRRTCSQSLPESKAVAPNGSGSAASKSVQRPVQRAAKLRPIPAYQVTVRATERQARDDVPTEAGDCLRFFDPLVIISIEPASSLAPHQCLITIHWLDRQVISGSVKW
jgi:hypothetical protein